MLVIRELGSVVDVVCYGLVVVLGLVVVVLTFVVIVCGESAVYHQHILQDFVPGE